MENEKTCGSCKFGHMMLEDVNKVQCRGRPPQMILTGVRQGPGGIAMQIENLYPTLPRNWAACGLHQPRIVMPEIERQALEKGRGNA